MKVDNIYNYLFLLESESKFFYNKAEKLYFLRFVFYLKCRKELNNEEKES